MMSRTLICALKTNLFTYSCANTLNKCSIPIRTLYSLNTLGVDGYEHARERTHEQFAQLTDKFRTKMTEYANSEQSKHMIFTEDLKNMIHLVESNDDDITLVKNMMKKFNKQNKELRFGSFIFGPVVMRMFHYLNQPEAALECFKAPELEGFFDQLMTYQLLLDLLYENERYDDVINTFEMIKSKQIQGTKYPKNIVVITLAACYKLNTEASFKHAMELWNELMNVGHLPMRRSSTFMAGLALKHGRPDIALEIISGVKQQNYVAVKQIRLLALADLDRVDEVLEVLKSMLQTDRPDEMRQSVFKDVLERIRDVFEKHNKPDMKLEFQRIEKYLTEQEQVTQTSLDSQLCSEIVSPPFLSNTKERQRQQQIPRYQYQGQRTSNTNNKYKVVHQRPGLREMY